MSDTGRNFLEDVHFIQTREEKKKKIEEKAKKKN